MTIFLSGAVLSALICAGTQVGQQTAEQAGAALAAGRAEEAAASAVACLPDPACALVRGRALLALGSFEQAAQALRLARSGETAVHAAKLEGESLVLAGQGGAAVEPLQFAAQHDPDGPAGVRAAALLADAFLEVGRFADAADQARKAAENPSQPNDVRVGLDLIGAEALSASPGSTARRAWPLQRACCLPATARAGATIAKPCASSTSWLAATRNRVKPTRRRTSRRACSSTKERSPTRDGAWRELPGSAEERMDPTPAGPSHGFRIDAACATPASDSPPSLLRPTPMRCEPKGSIGKHGSHL